MLNNFISSNMNEIIIGSLLAGSFGLCVFLCNWFIKLPHTVALIDIPGGRKIHRDPTLKTGGIVIYFTTLIFIIAFNQYLTDELMAVFLGATIFFIIGLIDDIFHIGYKAKIVGQFVGVVLFLTRMPLHNFDLSIFNIQFQGTIFYTIFIVIWIVGSVNAFNFMDGLNLLASGLGVIFLTGYIVYFYQYGITTPIPFICILIGSLLGFMLYNRTPARMFLGDSGSLFIGFIIVSIGFVFRLHRGPVVLMSFPLVIMLLPALDTLYIIGNRLKKRKNIFHPDTSHLHHQLLQLNIRQGYAVLIILGFAVLYTGLALLSTILPLTPLTVIYIILISATVIAPRLIIFFRRT